jgi:hypothetical protein
VLKDSVNESGSEHYFLMNHIVLHLHYKQQIMGSKKMIYQIKNTASSLNKATLIFKYADNHRWKFYVGLVFFAYRSWLWLS